MNRVLLLGALALIPFSTAPAQTMPAQLQRGTALLDSNRLVEARAQLTPYARNNPKDARGLAMMGRLLMFEGQTMLDSSREKEGIAKFGEAAGWLEKAVDIDENTARYHRWLGDAYGRQAQRTGNKLKQANLARKVKNEYEEAVRLDPKDLQSRLSLIEFYMQAPGFMGGGVDKAEAQAREIAKLDKLQGHYTLSNVYARQKKIEPALNELKAAERGFPDSVSAALRVGYLYVAEKRFDEAFAQFDRVIAKFPSDPVATFQIGRTAALSGQQLDRGEAALRKYLAGPTPTQAQPQFANAHFRLGMIYEKKGATSSARTAYSEALRLNPRLTDAKTALDKLK